MHFLSIELHIFIISFKYFQSKEIGNAGHKINIFSNPDFVAICMALIFGIPNFDYLTKQNACLKYHKSHQVKMIKGSTNFDLWSLHISFLPNWLVFLLSLHLHLHLPLYPCFLTLGYCFLSPSLSPSFILFFFSISFSFHLPPCSLLSFVSDIRLQR